MTEYPNIEAFYNEDPRRRASGEADFGVWWVEDETKLFPKWRVSYIRDTGEVYAIESGQRPSLRVRLLGTFPPDNVGPTEVYYLGLNRLLDGWASIPDKPLSWAAERLRRHQGETPA